MSQASRNKTCDKKFKTAELKVLKILSKIESLKLSNEYISSLDIPGEKRKSGTLHAKLKCYFLCFIISIFLIGAWRIYSEIEIKSCQLELPSTSKSLFRPPEDCSMCVGVDNVARVSNITAHEFELDYAYKATPVIVTDATEGWSAVKGQSEAYLFRNFASMGKYNWLPLRKCSLREFNFNFFANFYRNGKMGKQINDCFYFAYKSGFNSLHEVFTMDERRANLSGEPWYVGWSTCYDEETRKLRSFYNRPYFLPKTAESDMVDWVFMGGPGQGAHMHVDSVRHMSWQAQIRGRKQWQLAPPPECFYRCPWITFTVAPGEILVVDTNRWYHKTNVLPGDISITIGAEYD